MARMLPIYKIKGKHWFRDERLGEYRNVKNPHERMGLDSVFAEDFEKPTLKDRKMIWGK